MNHHLHILHLEGNTENDKTNTVANIRLGRLMKELEGQGIKDYTIMPGFYDPVNTKEAIHKGHRMIVELAKKQGFENCIIAEDDIVFSSPNSYKYFLSCIPDSYDLFCGLFYAGELKDNRVMNGASGIMTLYSIHNRFYDFFLSLNNNTHIDRELGLTAFEHEYYVVSPECVKQRGGYSHNLKRDMYYEPYLEGKTLYGQ